MHTHTQTYIQHTYTHTHTHTHTLQQITRKNIEDNLTGFNFRSLDDVAQYEKLLKDGFDTISAALASMDQVFVDIIM